MIVKIKDIDGNDVIVFNKEIYTGLAQILGLRQSAEGTIYWVDKDNWVYELTEFGFRKVETSK